MANGLNAAFRQLAINQGMDPNAVGGERLTALQTMQGGQEQAAAQRDLINQFYQDPARQEEINQRIGAGLNLAFQNIADQQRAASRQAAFQRAAAGNVGGSLQAAQTAGIQARSAQAAQQAAAQAEMARNSLAQALEAQRVQELMQTFQFTPEVQAQLQGQLNLLGVEDAQNSAMFALDQQRQEQQRFADDELSRVLAQPVNIASNAYRTDQLSKALGGRGVF